MLPSKSNFTILGIIEFSLWAIVLIYFVREVWYEPIGYKILAVGATGLLILLFVIVKWDKKQKKQ